MKKFTTAIQLALDYDVKSFNKKPASAEEDKVSKGLDRKELVSIFKKSNLNGGTPMWIKKSCHVRRAIFQHTKSTEIMRITHFIEEGDAPGE